MSKKLSSNFDQKTVDGFGDEWTRFDQEGISKKNATNIFGKYFSIFPWEKLTIDAVGFDLGCGSGRWAKFVAPHVKTLHCIDPSAAIDIAKKNLKQESNCIFHRAGCEDMPLKNGSMDFGYSLGVLHHIPDTFSALQLCVSKLKPGAPFLLYLYYAFDNRPIWFRFLWMVSDFFRRIFSRMPFRARYFVSQIVAISIYWPLAKFAKFLESAGLNVKNFPLAFYRNYDFYVMRTDALDRFGTRLEHRFSKSQIMEMMSSSGLVDISFSDGEPFWCAVGYAKVKN